MKLPKNVFRFLTVMISACLILTSCTNTKGNLEISANGLVSGQLTYSIPKAITSILGINSLEDLKARATEPSSEGVGSSNLDSCADTETKEDSANFIVTCTLRDSDYSSDKDFYIKREGSQIIVVYRQNVDSNQKDENVINIADSGTVRLDLNFETKVTEIVENKVGLVKRISESQLVIAGTATEVMDIKIIASASDFSNRVIGNPISPEIITEAINYKVAPRDFSGMMKENLRFGKRFSPYRVKEAIQIPSGIKAYVEPGVEFIAVPPNKNLAEVFSYFHVQGALYLDGRSSSPVVFDKSPNAFLKIALAKDGSRIYANFIEAKGGSNFIWSDGKESQINLRLHNSRITNFTKTWELVYPYGRNEIVGNVFSATSQMRFAVHNESGSSILVQGNVFEGIPKGHDERGKKCWIESVSNYGGKLRVTQNDFSKASEFALCVFYSGGAIDARGNYWKTLDDVEIGKKVLDSRDSLDYPSLIEVSNPLKTFQYSSSYSGSAIEQASRAVAEAALATVSAKEQAEEAQLAAAEASEKARLAAAAASAKADKTTAPKKLSKSSSSTITCVNRNKSLKVTGKKPVCPDGYMKK